MLHYGFSFHYNFTLLPLYNYCFCCCPPVVPVKDKTGLNSKIFFYAQQLLKKLYGSGRDEQRKSSDIKWRREYVVKN